MAQLFMNHDMHGNRSFAVPISNLNRNVKDRVAFSSVKIPLFLPECSGNKACNVSVRYGWSGKQGSGFHTSRLHYLRFDIFHMSCIHVMARVGGHAAGLVQLNERLSPLYYYTRKRSPWLLDWPYKTNIFPCSKADISQTTCKITGARL